MEKKTGLALHWKILIGMALGVAVGVIAVNLDARGEKDPDGVQVVLKNRSASVEFGDRLPGGIRTFQLVSPPGHGTVTIDSQPVSTFNPKDGSITHSPSGSATYQPDKNFTGSDTAIFAYSTDDSPTTNIEIRFQVRSRKFTWSQFVNDWIKPFGTIFISLLKLIALPLIVASLIKGVADLKDISSLSALGGKTVIAYLATTVCAVTLGLVIVNVVKPGKSFSKETQQALNDSYEGDATKRISAADAQKSKGPLQALVDVVPNNIFGATTSNGNMLKVIFFVLFFGVSLLLIDPVLSRPVKEFFNGLNEIILKMIDLIMLMAPLGVFALLSAQVVATPSVDVLLGLLAYSGCVIAGLGIMIFVFYPTLVVTLGGRGYGEFFRGISPAQLLAFSTSSSAATLPVTMDCVEDNLGVRKEVSSFVLPIGATVNMDGTSLYQAVAAVFIAQALGVELTLSDQLAIVLTATLASIGSAAVPGAGIVMLVIVLGSIGVSEKGIALIFAVDRILDMCRTAVNVTGDATVSLIVNNRSKARIPLE